MKKLDIDDALKALSALAGKSRLDAFRLLVAAGAQGMAAGAIADALAIPQNTLSAHLAILTNAGLIVSRRVGRSIIYRVDFKKVRALLAFLLEDCCQGRPEVCAPLLAAAVPGCCA
ncbi:MAG: ArsR/SmtB family transcription factor [Pseudomonadota bacterium]